MAQALLPVYFFPGPEIGRKREQIDRIRSQITKTDGAEPETHRFYPYENKAADITALLLNGSLFSLRRLVIVPEAHALKSADIKVFIAYLRAPSPEAVLIFTTDHTPGVREYPAALAKALPKAAVEVFWEMFERDKRGWVMRLFRERGIRIEPEAVNLLIDLTEGTSDALKEACERLCFTANTSGTVGEDDVDRILDHDRGETVYSLFDRLCRRDLGGVLDAYRAMIHFDPGAADRVLSMLADPLTRLRDFQFRLARGYSEHAAASEVKLRGGGRALRSYKAGASSYGERELECAVSGLIELESWLRGAPRELRSPKTELWLCKIIGQKIRAGLKRVGF